MPITAMIAAASPRPPVAALSTADAPSIATGVLTSWSTRMPNSLRRGGGVSALGPSVERRLSAAAAVSPFVSGTFSSWQITSTSSVCQLGA
jgi:hypothetical protein